MSEPKNQSYTYAFSASQQAEIRAIRQRYLPEGEDPMARLRRLDGQPAQKAGTAALSLGIISALVMGLGMSCCMVWGGAWFWPGILIGLIGMAGAAAAYPLYQRIEEKEKARIAPEILRLTEELMK